MSWPVARGLVTGVAVLLFVAAGLAVAAIGLVAPGWAQVMLVVVWVVGLERLIAWRRRPALALTVAVAMWVVLVGTVVVGDVWLGWTA
ncbi:MAG: hypothetical protein HKN41_00745 [Ilumatobacter sp.]|nr:hypothetical protein [Ilumatobacter sp.]